MRAIERFEDIEAWQKARVLTRFIYKATNREEFSKDFGLKDQVRRATVSILANIAEGFERGGDREFIQFLSTAKGSAAEVKSHLYVALDAEYITQEQFERLYELASEVGRLLGGFIRYLSGSELRGSKYRNTGR